MWNIDQLKAIQASGRSVMVSASAGAGKTTVLVERLIQICTRKDNPIDLDRIIAMTFTDAAAAEMKKRLSVSLSEQLQKEDSDKNRIQKQLVLLSTAQISTIHSFCLSIIKKYYDVINLNPKMIENNLDDATVSNLKSKAFKEAFLEYSKSNDTLELTNNFSTSIFNLDSLEKSVLNIVNEANSSFNADIWYETTLSNYKIIKTIEEVNDNVKSSFFNSIIHEISILKDYCDKLIDQFEQENSNDFKADYLNKGKATFIKRQSILIDCLIALKNQQYQDFTDMFIKLKDIKFSKNAKLSEIFVLIYDAYKKHYDSLNKTPYLSESLLVETNNLLYPLIKQLLDIAKLTSANFKNLKKEICGFDFDDMEHFAYDILTSNNNMIANQIKEEYDEIYVDEFQDTNDIQNEIVNLISRNNVFRVGDVKQSIYRFRKAKPQIMRGIMNDESYERISLKHNYRSQEYIVDFTNFVFERLMNVNNFSDTYTEIDHVHTGSDKQKIRKGNLIKFYSLPDIKDFGESNDEDLMSFNNNKEIKANFISRKILELINSNNGQNNYKYSDFVVLLRGHADKIYLKKSFDQYNIPNYLDTKSGFYSSWMALILLSYLKLIVDDKDEISLMSVLSSPLYEMSDETMAKFKIKHGSLLKGCINEKHPILDDIKRLKHTYSTIGITPVLDEISLINDFISEKCNVQEQTNFDMFYEKAQNFEKTSLNLFEFIYNIETFTDEKSSEATSVGSDEDLVKAVTIHQSKGLQYKVVFLWASSNNPRGGSSDAILLDPNLGIGMNYIDSTYFTKYTSLQHTALKYNNKKEESQEHIRLLYVALTRAQEELYIVDTIKNNTTFGECDDKYLIQNINSTSMLMSVLPEQYIEKIDYDFFIKENLEPKTKNEINKKIEKYKLGVVTKEIEVVTPSKNSHEISLDIDFNNTSFSANRGTLMHQCIEYYQKGIWSKEDISTKLNSKDKQHVFNFFESDIYKECINKTIYNEYPFIIKIDNKVINGIIDFLAIDDKEIIIIDFKSDRNTTEQKLLETYSEQLNFYVSSLSNIYPNLIIKAYIYSFELDDAIQVRT